MIEEQYVSFEVAKLLKEKGFIQNIATYYLDDNIYRHTHIEVIPKDKEIFAAPTQSLVMRWLREVHNIACQISPAKEKGFHTNKWHSYVDKLSDNWPRESLWFVETSNSYEEACEAAIKYCLNKLL